MITHPVDQTILRGVTRTTLLALLGELGLALEERAFSLEEAHAAREAFVTGATTLVMPVVAIDDRANRRRTAWPRRHRSAPPLSWCRAPLGLTSIEPNGHFARLRHSPQSH